MPEWTMNKFMNAKLSKWNAMNPSDAIYKQTCLEYKRI